LFNDDSVAGQAVQALGALHPPGIRTATEPFTTHPQAWIREEVRKALTKIPNEA
jgi:hypothetical protein